MSEEVIKHRLALWLRSEQALGLAEVKMARVKLPAKSMDKPPAKATSQPVVSKVERPVVVAPSAPVSITLPATASRSAPVNLFGQPAAGVPDPAATGASPLTAPVLARDEKIAGLAQMDEREVKGCVKCRLSQTRTHTVFGEGDPDAAIFFIGEGPGENEDLQGRPFVGRAGELLNKMIAGMGLQREQVFIANIVKCRPPGNRVPVLDEVQTCTPYLVRQLEIIRPKVIVTLGLPAAKYMLNSNSTMGRLRGQWQNWRGIPLMPTYHPSYILRAYTEANRAAVWSDLKLVMTAIGLEPPTRARS